MPQAAEVLEHVKMAPAAQRRYHRPQRRSTTWRLKINHRARLNAGKGTASKKKPIVQHLAPCRNQLLAHPRADMVLARTLLTPTVNRL